MMLFALATYLPQSCEILNELQTVVNNGLLIEVGKWAALDTSSHVPLVLQKNLGTFLKSVYAWLLVWTPNC